MPRASREIPEDPSCPLTTPRERTVLAYVANGYSPRDVGEILGYGPEWAADSLRRAAHRNGYETVLQLFYFHGLSVGRAAGQTEQISDMAGGWAAVQTFPLADVFTTEEILEIPVEADPTGG